ncbi:MAG: alkene reductase, partial [Methylococcaceae bacterium]|nr:alkene reductase [Methylococcaceae bacterium]
LAPSGTFNDMTDSVPEALFVYVLEQLNPFNLAYLHVVDALESDIRHGAKVVDLAILRAAYHGTLIVCGGYDYERANETIAKGLADAVAFGVLYIANPDPVERFAGNAPLNEADASTFYGGEAKGYTDYPTLAN